jgi:hypothetical protein
LPNLPVTNLAGGVGATSSTFWRGDGSWASAVTSVGTTLDLTGGTITSTGTLGLANTAVVPGTYNIADITVDAKGRLTNASSALSTVTSPTTQFLRGDNTWQVPAGSGGTVSSVGSGTGLTGGPITTTGTLALTNTGVTSGSYSNANISIDAQGRITNASSGPGSITAISAAVYDSTGKLVRTLWSNRPQVVTSTSWDGRLDFNPADPATPGSIAPNGTYTIKYVTGSPAYTWEGVVGNTNASSINLPWQAQDVAYSMAITSAGAMFVAAGYNEARTGTLKSTTANPQTSDYVLKPPFHVTAPAALLTATDGTLVYWAGFDAFEQTTVSPPYTGQTAHTFVWASTIGSDGDSSLQYSGFTGASPNTWAVGNDGSNTYKVCNLTPTSGYPSFTTNGIITGLAVQRTKPFSGGTVGYLFVTRAGLNRIDVINKTTGATVQTITPAVTSPGACCVCDSDLSLWVCHATSVQKYTIGSTGTLTPVALAVISGLAQPLAVDVSVDNATMIVADGGNQQVVRSYTNPASAAPVAGWVLGTVGGYASSPTVINTKFMFQTIASGITIGSVYQSTGSWKHPQTFLCFDRTTPVDGSFWMGDPGNMRSLHWAAGASTGPAPSTLMNTLSWIPAFYSCYLCQGDSTRVFASYLEFKIDYTKSLGPNNGSWVLANNWSTNIPTVFGGSHVGQSNSGYDGAYFTICTPTIFSNGLTYALTRYVDSTLGTDELRISCLTTTGMQFTGQSFLTNPYIPSILPDGSIAGLAPIGSNTVWSRQPFLNSYDASTPPHPQWGSAVLVQSPTLAAGEPYPASSIHATAHNPTSGGTIPIYFGQTDNFGSTTGTDGKPIPGPNRDGRHFGGMDSTTGAWKFQCAPSTPQSTVPVPPSPTSPVPPGGVGVGYGFGFTTCQSPLDGFFDRRLSLSNQTSAVTVFADQILYNMNGEQAVYVLAGGETNIWRHYHEDGLMIGQFGPVQDRTYITSGPFAGQNPYCTNQVGMAGNPVAGWCAVVGGTGYLYHNDEGFKAGIHRWRINGLDTLQYGSISVSWTGSVTPPPSDSTDMLSGLPKISTLPATSSGWTRSPTADIYNNLSVDWWSVTTNAIVYDPAVSPDINIAYACPASPIAGSTPGDASVTRALPTITGPWHFSCNVMLPTAIATAGGWVAGGAGSYIRLELQDAAGRAIIRLELADTAVIVNGVNFIGTPLGTNNDQFVLLNTISFPQLFAVTQSGTQFNVTYGTTTQLISKSDPAADTSVSPPVFKVIFHFVAGSLNRSFTVNLSDVRFSNPPAPSSGTGTVTSVGTGTGLTGGTITTSGTISLQASLAPLASYTWPASIGTTGQVLTLGATPANLAWQTPAAGATPTASAGLTAIAGGAPTFMRSDGAPAISVAIAPIWSSAHTFNANVTMGTPGPAGTTGTLIFANATNANVTTIQASTATTTAQTYLLPTTVGTAGQALVLSTVSPNQLGWASAGGGGVTTVANGTGISVASPTGPTATVSVNTAAALTWTATETFSATIDLPHTTGAGVGVITKAGSAFIHDSGTSSLFIGVGAGNYNPGIGHIGIGAGAAASLQSSANYNTMIGFNAGNLVTSGSFNTLIGYSTGSSATSGGGNVAIGYQCLKSNIVGNYSVAIGYNTLQNALSGGNVAVGIGAGASLASGHINNLFLGNNNAPTGAGQNYTGSNNIVIGAYGGVGPPDTISNSIVIASADGSTVYLDMGYTSGLSPVGVSGTWTFRAPVRVQGGAQFLTTTSALTAGATGNAPTMGAGPVAGNPNKWIAINDNGTTRWIPTWA